MCIYIFKYVYKEQYVEMRSNVYPLHDSLINAIIYKQQCSYIYSYIYIYV